jgi:hypothetical protein
LARTVHRMFPFRAKACSQTRLAAHQLCQSVLVRLLMALYILLWLLHKKNKSSMRNERCSNEVHCYCTMAFGFSVISLNYSSVLIPHTKPIAKAGRKDQHDLEPSACLIMRSINLSDDITVFDFETIIISAK